jgi:hypothetical protein
MAHWQEEMGDLWFSSLPEQGTERLGQQSTLDGWWWRNYRENVLSLTVNVPFGDQPISTDIQPKAFRDAGTKLVYALHHYDSDI